MFLDGLVGIREASRMERGLFRASSVDRFWSPMVTQMNGGPPRIEAAAAASRPLFTMAANRRIFVFRGLPPK